MQARTYCSWVGPQEVTTTASTLESTISSSPVAKARALPMPSATPLCARQVHVAHGGHGSSGQNLRQATDMILADHTDANNSHIDGHTVFSFMPPITG